MMASVFKSQTLWTGNTYPHRDYIKGLGGKWDDTRKGWVVPKMSMRERSNVKVPPGVNVSVLH
jgi:hypothetical protein